jgi:hypothetical protein
MNTSSYLKPNGMGWRQQGRDVAMRESGNGNGGVALERRRGWREGGGMG